MEKHRPRVLLVDDEAQVLKSLRRLLRSEPWEIVACQNPEEALAQVRDAEEPFAAVLSDQRMPEMSGAELLTQIRAIAPQTVRLVLTGYADIQSTLMAVNEGAVYRYLQKPWDDESLKASLREAVDRFVLGQENARLEAVTQKQNDDLRALNETLEQRVQERTAEVERLAHELKSSFLGSVGVLAQVTELHSPLVGSHAKRVAALTRAVAERLELPDAARLQLEVAASLHDVGKIGLPAEILQREARHLKPKQLELLRAHPVKGQAIVALMPNLESAAKMVRHHHERFDGKGYPEGLRGNDIPLGARIIAAVDAYDHVLNSRAGLKSTSPERALETLRKHAGAFDPEVLMTLSSCVMEDAASAVEVEIHARDLEAGMVLSRDLKTGSGALLLPKGATVQREQIGRIRQFQESDPGEGIFILRTPPGGQSSGGEPESEVCNATT